MWLDPTFPNKNIIFIKCNCSKFSFLNLNFTIWTVLITKTQNWTTNKKVYNWKFPGGPVVRTWCFHCRALAESLTRELRSSKTCVWRGCSVTQTCLTFWDLLDCTPPGSSVHGISQARILEWVAISFSRVSSRPRNWTCVSCIDRQTQLPLHHPGSPFFKKVFVFYL